MPTLKLGTIIPTDEEDAIIQAGIALDPDTYELTDADFAKLKPASQFTLSQTSEKITVSLSPEIVNMFKSTGQDWQINIETALRQYLIEHPI